MLRYVTLNPAQSINPLVCSQ